MKGKTRKLWLRICAFAVVLFMLAGEIAVPALAEEIDIDIAEEVVTEVSAEEEGEIDLIDESILASDEEFVEENTVEDEDVLETITSDEEVIEIDDNLVDEEEIIDEDIDLQAADPTALKSISVPKIVYLDLNNDTDSNEGINLPITFSPKTAVDQEYTLSVVDADNVIANPSEEPGADNRIVEITEDGHKIAARNLGSINVTVTPHDTGAKAVTTKVTIMTIDPGYTELVPGETVQLNLIDETGKKYSAAWKSNNSRGAIVDSKGLVTALNSNSSDKYSNIYATFGGKEFVAGVKTLIAVETISATTDNNVLEVWDNDGKNHGWDNSEANIEVITYPAGLDCCGDMREKIPNPQSLDEYKTEHGGSEEGYKPEIDNPDYNMYANTSFIVLDGNDKYLDVDPWGHVFAKYPKVGDKYYDAAAGEEKTVVAEDLLENQPDGKVEVKVKVEIITYDYHNWSEGFEQKKELGRADATVTFTVALRNYEEKWLSDEERRICVMKGQYETVGEIELPESVKNDGWEWLYPQESLEQYEKVDFANIPIGIINKNTGEILNQNCMDVEFFDGPMLRLEKDTGNYSDNIVYFEDEQRRKDDDRAGIAIVYQPDYSSRFWEHYRIDDITEWDEGQQEEVVVDPAPYKIVIDSDNISCNDVLVAYTKPNLYKSWEELERIRGGHDENPELNPPVFRFRAVKAGVGTVEVPFKVVEVGNEGNVIAEGKATTSANAIVSNEKTKGIFNGQFGIYRYDASKKKINIDDDGLEFDTEIDTETWTHLLKKGQSYALVLRKEEDSKNIKVTVKAADASVVAVGKNDKNTKVYAYKDPEKSEEVEVSAEFGQTYEVYPLTIKNIGLGSILIDAADDLKSSDGVLISVIGDIENEKPTLISTYTIKSAVKDEFKYTELLVKFSFNNRFICAYLDNDIEHPLDTFDGGYGSAIKLAGTPGKHDLHLRYQTGETEAEYKQFDYKITIKEDKKVPSVKIKQTQTLNTSFKNIKDRFDMDSFAGKFTVTTDGAPILADEEGVKITVKNEDGNELIMGSGDWSEDDPYGDYRYDYESGCLTLFKDPGKFMTVQVVLDQYDPAKVPAVKVTPKKESRKYTISSKTGTVVTDSGRDGDGNFTGEFSPRDVRLMFQIMDSMTKQAVDLNDFDDEHRVELSADMKSGNMDNVYCPEISDDRMSIRLVADDNNTAPAAKGDVVNVRIKRPEWTAPQEFTYTIKGTALAKSSITLGSKSLKLYNYEDMSNCSVSTSFTIKGGASIDLLNDTGIYQVVNAKKGEEVILGKDIRFEIDANNGTLRVVKNSENLKAGKYKFNLELACPLWKKNQTASITVEVIDVKLGNNPDVADKNKIMVKASQKGKIDVLDRENTSVVVTPSFTNIPADARIEFRELVGAEAQTFRCVDANNAAVTLKLDRGRRVLSTKDYKVQLKYFVDLGYGKGINIVTPEIKIELTQGKSKSVVSGNTSYLNTQRYEPHWLPLTVTNASGNVLRVSYVEISETMGFRGYFDYDPQNIVLEHEYIRTSVSKKTYSIKVKVYLESGFVDKPVDATIKASLN